MLLKKCILFLLLLMSFSCSRYIGYGVVKISEDEDKLKSGTLIKITNESRIWDTWIYNTDEEKHVKIEKWRIKYFKKMEEASAYQEEYLEYDGYYAVSRRNGQAMRIKPIFPKTTEVYSLKKNQKVKIIGRTDEMQEHDRFNGYWWKLITDEGIEGWTYYPNLNIYKGDELIYGEKNEIGTEIEDFFKNVWRPVYFQEMIDSRNIDLNKFKPKFGLFPDKDKKEIYISMPDHNVLEKYTEIIPTGKYNYQLEDTSIQLDFSYKGMVMVTYSQDYTSYYKEFLILNSNVNDIINTEKSKRSIKYNEFTMNGPVYKSRAYGEITFGEGNTFIWKNNENLKAKQLLTSNAGIEGKIYFNTFLSNSLKGKYEGSITFDFGSRQKLTFLYNFEDNGVRFLYIPPSKIKDSTIKSDDMFSPIQLFFTGN